MMSSKNTRAALFLAVLFVAQLIAAALSLGSPFFFVWVVLAAVTAFVLARWLRGRPCEQCGQLTCQRYVLTYPDGSCWSSVRVCAPCGADLVQDQTP
jgi:hypothetical protein